MQIEFIIFLKMDNAHVTIISERKTFLFKSKNKKTITYFISKYITEIEIISLNKSIVRYFRID
jgi:hypothetical protein